MLFSNTPNNLFLSVSKVIISCPYMIGILCNETDQLSAIFTEENGIDVVDINYNGKGAFDNFGVYTKDPQSAFVRKLAGPFLLKKDSSTNSLQTRMPLSEKIKNGQEVFVIVKQDNGDSSTDKYSNSSKKENNVYKIVEGNTTTKKPESVGKKEESFFTKHKTAIIISVFGIAILIALLIVLNLIRR